MSSSNQRSTIHSSKGDFSIHQCTPTPTTTTISNNNDNQSMTSSLDGNSSFDFTCHELTQLQVFVRTFSEGNTIVVHADRNDTVEHLQFRIQLITQIPATEQRLIYQGKQLQMEYSLADCHLEKDSVLQLVGRMRSTKYPRIWQLIDEMASVILRLCKGEAISSGTSFIENSMSEFLTMAPLNDKDTSHEYLQIFMNSSTVKALVMLYVSPFNDYKQCADKSIRCFLTLNSKPLPKTLINQFASIIIEFCKLLKKHTVEDPLYNSCRTMLASLLQNIDISRTLEDEKMFQGLVMLHDLYPFTTELVDKLCKDLTSSMDSVLGSGPSLSYTHDFVAFLKPLRIILVEEVAEKCPIDLTLQNSYPYVIKLVIDHVHVIFVSLLEKMDKCLLKMEAYLVMSGNKGNEIYHPGWSTYLIILKELDIISELYQGAKGDFRKMLHKRKLSVCALVIRYSGRTNDHSWILQHKDVTNFQVRRHLTMLMLPEVRDDYEELQEMLIDRSKLLEESFEYIAHSDAELLRNGLLVEFNNEEATGPGVLREWFYLVCQALFNTQNALFVTSSSDCRRYYPNPVSTADPLQLEYYKFAGRMIALALMHNVQVGIIFDRMFFLQMGSYYISLDDIKDTDPCLYNSFKQLQEMDEEIVDSDGLGLTFIMETEELGCRKVLELCPGGESVTVNSKNRNEFIDLFIQCRFVASISQKLASFVQGFADIVSYSTLKLLFRGLNLEDLDSMLLGSESPLDTDQWKKHTKYNGYAKTDPQIAWFWKIVGEMSEDQKKSLLTFWTSMKYLPVEGFCGLGTTLYICKNEAPLACLPTSHTCFFQLCFPCYPSMAIMRERFRVITQEYVGSSFGTW